MRLAANPATWVRSLVAELPRLFASRSIDRVGGTSRRTTRCIIVVFALGVSLHDVALCLCVPGSMQSSEKHNCCPKPEGHHADTLTVGTAITTPSCCSAPIMSGFTARVESREVLSKQMAGAFVTNVAPNVSVTSFTTSVFTIPFRYPASHLPTVLRI